MFIIRLATVALISILHSVCYSFVLFPEIPGISIEVKHNMIGHLPAHNAEECESLFEGIFRYSKNIFL